MGGKQIDGLQLFAGYIPKKGSARLEYRTHNGQAPLGEMFSLVFFHDDFNRMRDGGQGTCGMELGNSYFTATKRQGEFSYYFQVSMYGDPKTWMGDTRTPRERDVERYLTSAKGFLDAALPSWTRWGQPPQAHPRRYRPANCDKL